MLSTLGRVKPFFGRACVFAASKRRKRPGLELLEGRCCPSSFYQYDIIAQTGQQRFSILGSGPSINSSGAVAFQGTMTRSSDGKPVDNIFVYNPTTKNTTPLMSQAYELPSQGPIPTQRFGQSVQLTDSGRVAAYRELDTQGFEFGLFPVPLSFTYLESWSSSDPPTQIAMGNAGIDPFTVVTNPSYISKFPTPLNRGSLFPSVFQAVSINDSGQSVFAAKFGNDTEIVTGPHATGGTYIGFVVPGNIQAKPQIDSAGDFVYSTRDPSNPNGGTINLGSYNSLVLTAIAGRNNGFQSVGPNPGISNDGSVIVFTGNRGNGPGVFASINDGSGSRRIVRVAGENTGQRPELGYDDYARLSSTNGNPDGDPIYFSSFDLNASLSVEHQASTPSGIQAGDSFIVSFVATPSEASISEPINGTAFTANRGIWTAQVFADAPLLGTGPVEFHTNIALPVVQQNQTYYTINGTAFTVTGFSDITSLKSSPGDASTQVDHTLAIEVTSTIGEMIVSATHHGITASQLHSIMQGLPIQVAQSYMASINRAFAEFNILTPARQAAFLAQAAVESKDIHTGAEMTHWTEYYNGTDPIAYFDNKYDNKLGNILPHDGSMFRGRGPLQVTGRDAYTLISSLLGLLDASGVQTTTLLTNPGLVEDRSHPQVGFLASAAFWSYYKGAGHWNGGHPNTLADQATLPGINIDNLSDSITKVVQGALSQYMDRRHYYHLALAALGVL